MNEAEFQNQVINICKTLFPGFQNVNIRCQGNFTIKFGHHNVTINGDAPSRIGNRGIYDVLVIVDDKPLIMFELKRPNVKLSNADVHQGVSYARLTDPITPLTVISNGNESLVIDTYTKNELTKDELSENIFERISHTMRIAADEINNSLTTLLQKDQDILFGVIQNLTDEERRRLTGKSSEWGKPIINDFQVIRSKLEDFTKFTSEKKFLILHGDAYIGKTNFIFQYATREYFSGNACLYINCRSFGYSIFERLANQLTSVLSISIDKTQVKEWILLHFNEDSERKITLIYDHLERASSELVQAEIAELIDIFKNTKNQIVLCIDNSSLKSIIRVANRNEFTLIGSNFSKYELGMFDTHEYFQANELLYKNYIGYIERGGEFSREYRTPRLWRSIINRIGTPPEPNHFAVIVSIPGGDFFTDIRSSFELDREITKDFIQLSKAYVSTIKRCKKDSELHLMAMNINCIHEEDALNILSKESIQRLLDSGFIERRPYKDLEWIYIPKLPELFAGYTHEYLKEKFLEEFRIDFESTYSEFILTCEFILYGELIAAQIIGNIGLEDTEIFSLIIGRILDDEPSIQISTGEKTVAMYIDPHPIELTIGEGIETKFLGNLFPYLILSHLTGTRFGDDSTDPDHIRFVGLAKVSNCDSIVRRADQTNFHDGIPMMEFSGIGELMQTNIGIIEPIVKSIAWNIYYFPEKAEQFFDAMLADKNYRVLSRIYMAAKHMNYPPAEKVTRLKNKILDSYEKLVPKMLSIAYTEANSTRAERRRLEKKIKKANEGKS